MPEPTPAMLTQDHIEQIVSLKMTTAATDKALAERFGVPIEAIKEHTDGIKAVVLGEQPVEPSQDAPEAPTIEDNDLDEVTDKTEKQLHKQMLDALRGEGITPVDIAKGLKKMLDSNDLDYVSDAIKELSRIMGTYSQKDRTPIGNSNVTEQKYRLRLPERRES